jgi:hypothetical protein
MKKLFIALFILTSFLSCNKDDNPTNNSETIIGRWHLVGFEDTVMYDFKTDEYKYTIYSDNGEFGPTETNAIPNPNPWFISDGKIHIDLFFGNMSESTLSFRCNGKVVDFLDDEGEVTQTLFREGYNYSDCN